MCYASRLLQSFEQSNIFLVAYFSGKPHDSYTITDNSRSPDASLTEEAKSNGWFEMHSTTIEEELNL